MTSPRLLVWRCRVAGHKAIYSGLAILDKLVRWRRPWRRKRTYPLLRWAEARDLVASADLSGEVEALRERLASEFAGKSCVVVGSAPELSLPANHDGVRYVTANGSLRPAMDVGVQKVSLHVLNSTSLKASPEQAGARHLLRDLKVVELVLFANGGQEKGLMELLADTGLIYDRLTVIDHYQRAALVLRGTGMHLGFGRRDDRTSTGLTAAALALWAGASDIVLAGISMSGGHSYLSTKTPRHHVIGDTMFILEMARQRKLSTTNLQLARQFSLPLAKGR